MKFGHFDPLLAIASVPRPAAPANNDSHNNTPGSRPYMLTYYSDDHHLHHGSCELRQEGTDHGFLSRKGTDLFLLNHPIS
jgi:hypothetical protein